MRKYVRNNISKNDNIYSLAWWLAEGWKYKFSYPNDKSVDKVLSNVVGFILFLEALV